MIFSCRICFERAAENLVPISDKIEPNINIRICEVIQYCTQIETSIYDPLPQYICKTCLGRLKIAFKLKSVYISSNSILRRKYDGTENVVNLAQKDKNGNLDMTDCDQKLDESTSTSTCSLTSDLKSNAEMDNFEKTSSPSSEIDGSKEQEPEAGNSGELDFICKTCDFSCDSLELLSLHATNIHPKDSKKVKNQCNVCKILLSDRSSLILHKRVEHPEIYFLNCQFCDKKFSRKILLKQHVNVVHLKIKNFQCNKCFLKFGQKTQLNKHICGYLADAEVKMES